MPSGKVHAEVTLAAAGLIYAWGLTSGETPVLAAATAAGCAMGVIFTPDLDIAGSIRADAVVKRTGIFPAVAWDIFWYPYGLVIPHRSWLSHGPIIGTIIRLVYIAVPLLILGILPKLDPLLVRAIGGLVISDNLHTGADFIVTGIQDIIEIKAND